MPMGKRIGAAGAVAVAAVLCGTAMVGTVHEGLAAELLPPYVFREPPPLPPKQWQDNSVLPHSSVLATGKDEIKSPPISQPVAPRLPAQGELAVPSAPTDVGEAQEVEGLRLAKPAPLAVRRGKAAELDFLNEVQTYNLSAKVNDLYAQAGPGIITKINDAHGTLTKSQVESVVNNELVSTITEKTKEPGSDISFEIFTGKLKIQKVTKVWGVDISGGEVNIYKISEALAAIIYACEKLSAPQFSNCLDAAVTQVQAIVIKAIGENDAVAGSNGWK
jgi:hypothetical protein